MSEASGEFWKFSLALYRHDAVPPACLAIQDEGGADVNVALYLLWLARRGIGVDATALAQIEATIGPWREQVVKALRGVRRVMKTELARVGSTDTGALRDQVKRLELESERLEHAALESLAGTIGTPSNSDRGSIAYDSMAAYSRWLGRELPAGAVATLVAAASY